jgi:hypothetical protein
MSEVRVKAIKILEEELGDSKDKEYGFGEWVEAKDRAVQRVSVFIDRTNKESESDLREFWINVKSEILNNL